MHKRAPLVAGIISAAVLFLILLPGIFISYFGILNPSSFSPDLQQKALTTGSQAQGITDTYNEAGYTTPQPPTIPGMMIFEDYGVNLYVSPEEKPLSTFALDVDTGSYTITQQYLDRNQKPPREAIRIEEFVNAIEYTYPQPENTLGLTTELTTTPYVAGEHILRIGVQAQDTPREQPLNIILVIDQSGSMRTGNRLELLKDATERLLTHMRAGDKIAVVSYETTARKELDFTDATETETIMQAVRNLQPRGSTNAEAGLTMGYNMISKEHTEETLSRVILMSDGVANVGTTNEDQLAQQLKQYKEQGIYLTTIGVGLGNYNDKLMEQLADQANGNYYYINNQQDITRVFDFQLPSIIETIADDVKIQVEMHETVQKYRLLGYENRQLAAEEFREGGDGAELGSGQASTALYLLKLEGEGPAATITLRYTDNEGTHEQTTTVNTQEQTPYNQATTNTKKALAAAQTALILKQAAPPQTINTVNTEIRDFDEPQLQAIAQQTKEVMT